MTCRKCETRLRSDNQSGFCRKHAFLSEARREYSSHRRAAHRKRIADYKLARGCADCGYNKHACALDFDHLPAFEKMFNIQGSGKAGCSWEFVLAEIEKCEVVCANCHRVRTVDRLQRGS